MTHNQIEYWKLQEQKRSNLANETELNRSNLAKESENYRHNTVTEAETYRHNTVGESQVWGSQAETKRHNLAGETLARAQLGETVRHNQKSERLEGLRTYYGGLSAGAEAVKDLYHAQNLGSSTIKNAVDGIGKIIKVFA